MNYTKKGVANYLRLVLLAMVLTIITIAQGCRASVDRGGIHSTDDNSKHEITVLQDTSELTVAQFVELSVKSLEDNIRDRIISNNDLAFDGKIQGVTVKISQYNICRGSSYDIYAPAIVNIELMLDERDESKSLSETEVNEIVAYVRLFALGVKLENIVINDNMKNQYQSVSAPVDEDISTPRLQMGLSVSWAFSYPDIESLTKSSDFIGLVEIVNGVEVGAIASGFGDDVILERSTISSSTFSAKVIRGILAQEDMIRLYMTGNRGTEGVVEISDDPLMNTGEKWFIFAKLNSSGTYTILSGPNGRFSYNEIDNTISSMPNSPISLYESSLPNIDRKSVV